MEPDCRLGETVVLAVLAGCYDSCSLKMYINKQFLKKNYLDFVECTPAVEGDSSDFDIGLVVFELYGCSEADYFELGSTNDSKLVAVVVRSSVVGVKAKFYYSLA